MRPAVESDRELLLSWTKAFAEECRLSSSPDDVRRAIDTALRNGLRYFWEHGGNVVAMASVGGGGAGAVPRIGSVYTPPEFRGRGYATGITAALTTELLARARKCILYTDAANPTSNSIYQRIGYRPMSESVQYTFG
jgi:predicted GNAT family acetyltransferase